MTDAIIGLLKGSAAALLLVLALIQTGATLQPLVACAVLGAGVGLVSGRPPWRVERHLHIAWTVLGGAALGAGAGWLLGALSVDWLTAHTQLWGAGLGALIGWILDDIRGVPEDRRHRLALLIALVLLVGGVLALQWHLSARDATNSEEASSDATSTTTAPKEPAEPADGADGRVEPPADGDADKPAPPDAPSSQQALLGAESFVAYVVARSHALTAKQPKICRGAFPEAMTEYQVQWRLGLAESRALGSWEPLLRKHMGLDEDQRLTGTASRALDRIHDCAIERARTLDLDELQTLPMWLAELLEGFNGTGISLDGLSQLDLDAARKLAQFKGPLSLDGLTSLSLEAAQAFAGIRDQLSLDGLTSLDVPTATALAKVEGPALSLSGLSSLTPEVAAVLARFKSNGRLHGDKLCWGLCLNGVTALSPEAAEALGRYRGRLELRALTQLDPAAARHLGTFQTDQVRIDGLASLSVDTATALASWKIAKLPLDGLQTLDPKAARALARFEPQEMQTKSISLDGLRQLSPELARELARFKGHRLSLDGLTGISPQAVEALSEWQGKLSLGGLTSIDAHFVRTLGTRVRLAGVERFDVETARAMNDTNGYRSVALQVAALDVELVNALRPLFKGDKEVSFPRLRALDRATAVALGEWSMDNLQLDGLTAITPEVAAVLFNIDVRHLTLNGLTKLDPASEASLVRASHHGILLCGLSDAERARLEQATDGMLAPCDDW